MTTTRSKTSIARNAAANWLAFVFVAAVGFFLSPFIVRHLGNSAYGVWSLLVGVVGYLGLLDFGVRGAVTRYVAHHYAVGRNDDASSIASAALVLFGLFGLAAVLLAAAIAAYLPVLFNIPEGLHGDARLVTILGGLSVAVTLVGAVFGGIVTGLERFDVGAGIEMLITAARAIATLVALGLGHGLVALALIQLASTVVQGIATYVASRRLYPQLHLEFRRPLGPHMRTILSFSVILSTIHVLAMFIYYSNALIIAVFLPVSAVTFFAIAGSLADYGTKVAGALSRMMTPRVSAKTSIGATSVADILGTARVATLATSAIAVTFWLRGESFIELWMGDEYGAISGRVLRILAFVVWLSGIRSVAVSSIIGANRHRSLLPGLASEAICNIVISAVLVRPIGVAGVAIGTAIPNVLVALGYIPRCLSKSTGVPARRLLWDSWLRPSLACAPFAAAMFLFERMSPAHGLGSFFLQVLSGMPLIVATAAFVCVTAEERERIRVLLRGA